MPIKNEDEVSRRTRDLYERSLSAIENKNYGVAIDFLLDAISMEPEFLQAHKLLRATQVKQFGAKGTAALFKKGFALFTTMPGLGVGLSQLNSKPREAMVTAYKMLNQDPTNTQGLDLLIRAAQKLELPEIAVLAAESAVAASPNNMTFLHTLAELYRAADQPRKSQDVYEHMLELSPNDPDVISAMKDVTTLVHMSSTKIEEAESYRDMMRDTKQAVNIEQENKVVRSEDMINNLIEETQKRMEEQPENLAYVRKMADLYMQKGDYDNAQKSLEKAMEKEGGDPSLQKMLGDVKIKRVDVRLKELKAEIEKNPGDAQIKQQMVELQTQRDLLNMEEAERRVRSYPNDLSFRYELAVLYYKKGRINEALEQFQTSQRSPQLQIMSLNYLGLCFREQKMHDLAINQFQKAEKASVLMDNNKKEIIYNLGETYEQMGKKDEAMVQFKKLYEVDINYRDVSKKLQTLSQT